jgi:hypothetical protein
MMFFITESAQFSNVGFSSHFSAITNQKSDIIPLNIFASLKKVSAPSVLVENSLLQSSLSAL